MTNSNNKTIFLGEIETKFVPAEKPRKVHVRRSFDAKELLREEIGEDMEIRQKEVVIFLNEANMVMSMEVTTIGTARQLLRNSVLVARKAVMSGAAGVIIGHNRPGGNKSPMEADKRETKRLKAMLDVFEIKLLDSLILTSNDAYSFADNGERSLG